MFRSQYSAAYHRAQKHHVDTIKSELRKKKAAEQASACEQQLKSLRATLTAAQCGSTISKRAIIRVVNVSHQAEVGVSLSKFCSDDKNTFISKMKSCMNAREAKTMQEQL